MSKGLRHVFSPARFSAAEVVLGFVSLVLVIWLLWPENHSTSDDQRATWQQQLEESRRQQSKNLQEIRPVLEADSTAEDIEAVTIALPDIKQERRVLVKPSELADRRRSGQRSQPIATPVARSETFETARSNFQRKQPDQLTGGTETGQGAVESAAKATANLDAAAHDDQIERSSNSSDELPTPEIKIAAYSSEAIDLQSELEQLPDDGSEEAIATLPDVDGFSIESSSSTHVRQRPRDDAPSWLRNAVTASLADDRPVIAIVIDDLGLNRSGTKAFNELPAPLTLAFLPYAGNIKAQTEAARAAGHELMVHLPMEPLGSAWPGPDALISSLSHDEFVKRLETNLNRIQGYVGVNNHMGSRLTIDHGRMDLVMRELRKRDVLFLDSKTNSRSIASEMASRNGVPNTTRDVFLDHVIDIDKIRSQMALIERIARQTGSAVAIGHPHKATMEALRDWLPTLADRGFTLAPLSAVIARRSCNDELLIATETCGQYLQAQTPDVPTIGSEGG